MPIVGIDTLSVTFRPNSAGTHPAPAAHRPCGSAHRLRVFEDVPLVALHPEAAELVDALRRQAEVAHYRDVRPHHRRDRLRRPHPAFQLHRGCPALLLDQSARVRERCSVARAGKS